MFVLVDVRKGIIEDLPIDIASVDWVISNCVINLSPEKHRVFKEISRVLKPGGTMMVSDIVAENLPREINESRTLYSSCLAGAIFEKDYIAGLKEAGLVDVKVLNRLVYDEHQIEAFICSELNNEESCGCCYGGSRESASKKWAGKLQGSVWSAKIKARKPLCNSQRHFGR